MKSHGIFRWPRWAPILVVLALAAFAIVAVRSLREPVLRAAGWALVVNEPVASADIIVLSLDSGGAGALEAADLVQSGISKRVAVFMDPPSGEDHEFIRRGLPYEDAGARQIRQLRWLGVTDVMQIPRTDIGTEGATLVLPLWCEQHQFRSIVFVVSRDHSRRLRRVLDRVMSGRLTHVTVQPSRYSSFDPDRWWETRGGVRTEIIELQKLLLDFVLHPMSFNIEPYGGSSFVLGEEPRNRRARRRGRGSEETRVQAVFCRIGIPVFAALCDSVAGHRRWEARWRSRGIIVRWICCGPHPRTSST